MRNCGTKVKSCLASKIPGAQSVEIDLEAKTATVVVGSQGKISHKACVDALAGTFYEVTGFEVKRS